MSSLPTNDLVASIQAQVADDPLWQGRLNFDGDAGSPRVHLAVMREPYLSYILSGRKTIESRFSVNEVAPYGAVRADDIIAFKLVAGPVTAVARVADATYYRLDGAALGWLRRRFEVDLAIDDDSFWKARGQARYASLLRIAAVRPLRPVPFDKRDRRGWVVLTAQPPAVHRDQLALLGHSQEAPARSVRWTEVIEFTPEPTVGQLELPF